jgi:hypothetical protein
VGRLCPFAVSCPIFSSTVPLIHLGLGVLPRRVKNKGEFQSKNDQAKAGKVPEMQ